MNAIKEQCRDCACLLIERSRGHCYLFDRAPTELCMSRKPHLGRPPVPFVAARTPSRIRIAAWLAMAVLLVAAFHYAKKYEASMLTDRYDTLGRSL